MGGATDNKNGESPNINESWWYNFFGSGNDAGEEEQPEAGAASANTLVEGEPKPHITWQDMLAGRRYRDQNSGLNELFSRGWKYEQTKKDGKITRRPENQRWAEKGSGGDVKVSGYSRSTGDVRSHSRTRPDGDVGNNLSYTRKA